MHGDRPHGEAWSGGADYIHRNGVGIGGAGGRRGAWMEQGRGVATGTALRAVLWPDPTCCRPAPVPRLGHGRTGHRSPGGTRMSCPTTGLVPAIEGTASCPPEPFCGSPSAQSDRVMQSTAMFRSLSPARSSWNIRDLAPN